MATAGPWGEERSTAGGGREQAFADRVRIAKAAHGTLGSTVARVRA